jgi:hypothetical protein
MEGHTDGDLFQELSKWFDERLDAWISGWKKEGWMRG